MPNHCWYQSNKYECGLSLSCVFAGAKVIIIIITPDKMCGNEYQTVRYSTCLHQCQWVLRPWICAMGGWSGLAVSRVIVWLTRQTFSSFLKTSAHWHPIPPPTNFWSPATSNSSINFSTLLQNLMISSLEAVYISFFLLQPLQNLPTIALCSYTKQLGR